MIKLLSKFNLKIAARSSIIIIPLPWILIFYSNDISFITKGPFLEYIILGLSIILNLGYLKITIKEKLKPLTVMLVISCLIQLSLIIPNGNSDNGSIALGLIIFLGILFIGIGIYLLKKTNIFGNLITTIGILNIGFGVCMSSFYLYAAGLFIFLMLGILNAILFFRLSKKY